MLADFVNNLGPGKYGSATSLPGGLLLGRKPNPVSESICQIDSDIQISSSHRRATN
jgi:hypothetical protein